MPKFSDTAKLAIEKILDNLSHPDLRSASRVNRRTRRFSRDIWRRRASLFKRALGKGDIELNPDQLNQLSNIAKNYHPLYRELRAGTEATSLEELRDDFRQLSGIASDSSDESQEVGELDGVGELAEFVPSWEQFIASLSTGDLIRLMVGRVGGFRSALKNGGAVLNQEQVNRLAQLADLDEADAEAMGGFTSLEDIERYFTIGEMEAGLPSFTTFIEGLSAEDILGLILLA